MDESNIHFLMIMRNLPGPVPRKMIKFNPGLSQILSKVPLVYESVTLGYKIPLCPLYFEKRNDNTTCYSISNVYIYRKVNTKSGTKF